MATGNSEAVPQGLGGKSKEWGQKKKEKGKRKSQRRDLHVGMPAGEGTT